MFSAAVVGGGEDGAAAAYRIWADALVVGDSVKFF